MLTSPHHLPLRLLQPQASSFGSWKKVSLFWPLSLCTCCSPSLHPLSPTLHTTQMFQLSTDLSCIIVHLCLPELPRPLLQAMWPHQGHSEQPCRPGLCPLGASRPRGGDSHRSHQLQYTGSRAIMERPEEGCPTPGKPTHSPHNPYQSAFQPLLPTTTPSYPQAARPLNSTVNNEMAGGGPTERLCTKVSWTVPRLAAGYQSWPLGFASTVSLQVR